MKRGRSVVYTIDVYAGGVHPSVGHVIRRLSARGVVLGFLRVLAVRSVRVRVSRGEEARYRVTLEWLAGEPDAGADSTVVDHEKPRRPR